MNKRFNVMISMIALLPLVLIAQGGVTDHSEKVSGEGQQRGAFHAADLVPRQSAGFENTFYTLPPLPY